MIIETKRLVVREMIDEDYEPISDSDIMMHFHTPLTKQESGVGLRVDYAEHQRSH